MGLERRGGERGEREGPTRTQNTVTQLPKMGELVVS